MSYSADTFVADEIPTTAKWNKLWSNDASFNDGSGIGAGAIIAASIGAGAVTATKIGTDSSFAWTAFTPTITAATGTFTTATGAGRFAQLGKLVVYQLAATITTIGTGTGCNFTLPITAQGSAGMIGTAREDATTGNMGVAKLSSTTVAAVARYDNGNIASGGSGSVVRVYGTYEAA